MSAVLKPTPVSTADQAIALDAAVEEVGLTDEARAEAAVGALVNLARRTDLHQPALGQDADAVGHGHRLLLVVGDEDTRDPHTPDQADELELGLLADALVERGERLVEQQQARLARQAARQRHALLLSAGERVRAAPGVGAHLHQLKHLVDAGRDRRARHARPQLAQAEGDVARHRHVREQRVGLEHHVGRTTVRGHRGEIPAVEQDAPATRRLQAGNHAQQGGLAAARAAQQREDLALADVERDLAHRPGVAEAFSQAFDAQMDALAGQAFGPILRHALVHRITRCARPPLSAPP